MALSRTVYVMGPTLSSEEPANFTVVPQAARARRSPPDSRLQLSAWTRATRCVTPLPCARSRDMRPHQPPRSVSTRHLARVQLLRHAREQIARGGSENCTGCCETGDAELGGDASGFGNCLVYHALPLVAPGALRQVPALVLGSVARFGLDHVAQKGHVEKAESRASNCHPPSKGLAAIAATLEMR
jgi:hypothetical protein